MTAAIRKRSLAPIGSFTLTNENLKAMEAGND